MNDAIMKRVWETIITFLICFGIDRLSKILILRTSGHIHLNSFLSFDVTINRGIAWGLFHTESTIGFVLISSIIFGIICAMLWYAFLQLKHGDLAIEEMLILAGAISNLFDRLFYSGVIDFIHIKFGANSFPIFNIADILIVTGVIWVLFSHYDN
jgi:signal peptidase II